MKQCISGIFSSVFSPRRFARERIKLPLAKFVYDTVDLYKSRTKTGVNNLREILFRGSIVALLTALVVWLSIFMYAAFYYVYVPTITHEKPVYLTFRSVLDKFSALEYFYFSIVFVDLATNGKYTEVCAVFLLEVCILIINSSPLWRDSLIKFS